MASDRYEGEHPALKQFSETGEIAKQTMRGAASGAIKGLLWTGGIALGVSLLTVGIAPLAGYMLGVTATGLLLTGAGLGAALGGGFALVESGEKVEEKKHQMIDNYERNEMLLERRAAIEMRRDHMRAASGNQAMSLGVSPNALPRKEAATLGIS